MDAQLGLVNADAQALLAAGNRQVDMDALNPYRFLPAIAPHIAAQQADIAIDLDLILRAYRSLANEAEVVVVEGAGGFLTPISAQQSLADLAEQLAIPIILVVGMRLGCINHALLTVAAIQARGLRLAGWVANSLAPNMPYFAENLSTLQQAIDAPCLSVVPWQGEAQFKLSL
jgi:dethiobiotin synthetase